MARNMFHVIPAGELDAERDILLGLPVEGTNKQAFHRVPLRSSSLEGSDGHMASPAGRVHPHGAASPVQTIPGDQHIVQKTQGLRRLLLRFPRSYTPGVRIYQQDDSSERSNVTLGFALWDHRAGPTPEEARVQVNLDNAAMFLRRVLLRCDRMRCTLKLGGNRMDSKQQEVAADMMDL